MSRRSKDQRREDYLDIGAALVAEAGPAGTSEAGLALAHVKLAEVAERAGVTKGALYHIWPSQEAYWSDLLQHLIDSNRLFGVDLLQAISDQLRHEPVAAEQLTVRDYANTLFEVLRDDPTFFARVSLFSYLHDEQVRSVLDEQFRVAAAAALPALERSIHDAGRAVDDEGQLWDLAVSIAALLDGMCLQHRISPERTPDLPLRDGQRWTLFAAAAEALLLAHTRAATDEHPGRSVVATAAG